jgi:hypothetical protein
MEDSLIAPPVEAPLVSPLEALDPLDPLEDPLEDPLDPLEDPLEDPREISLIKPIKKFKSEHLKSTELYIPQYTGFKAKDCIDQTSIMKLAKRSHYFFKFQTINMEITTDQITIDKMCINLSNCDIFGYNLIHRTVHLLYKMFKELQEEYIIQNFIQINRIHIDLIYFSLKNIKKTDDLYEIKKTYAQKFKNQVYRPSSFFLTLINICW